MGAQFLPGKGTSGTGVGLAVMHRQSIIREGLRSLLERGGGMGVVSEASCCAEALVRFVATPASLVLIELSQEGMRLAEQLGDNVPCLFITMQRTPTHLMLAALDMPVRGCVCLDDPDDLVRGCRAVLAHGTYITPGNGLSLIRELSARSRNAKLTEREVQILQGLCEGTLLSEVARRLDLATSTVKSHLSRIYQKLGVRNRKAAQEQAQALGLLTLNPRVPKEKQPERPTSTEPAVNPAHHVALRRFPQLARR